MRKYSQNNALTHLEYCINYNQEDMFFGVWEETAVHYGKDGGFNWMIAAQYGLKCYNIHKAGGAMVTQPGDICYACISKTKINFDKHFCQYLKQKLLEKGLNITEEKNDLLIDGKKFLGDMKITLPNGLYFYGGHISYHVNLPLIEKICTKPMEKVPVGLADYNITHNELESWVKEFSLLK